MIGPLCWSLGLCHVQQMRFGHVQGPPDDITVSLTFELDLVHGAFPRYDSGRIHIGLAGRSDPCQRGSWVRGTPQILRDDEADADVDCTFLRPRLTLSMDL
jgi:hypothetical protein